MSGIWPEPSLMIRCVQPRSTRPSTPWLSWTPPSTSSIVRSSKIFGTTTGGKPPGKQAEEATAPPSGKFWQASGSASQRVRSRITFLSTSARAAWSAVPCRGGSPTYIASKRQLWPVLSVVASSSRIGTGRVPLRVLFIGVEGALVALGLDQQVAHRDPAVALGPAVPGLRVEAPLVELADAVGARVRRLRHLEVLEQVRPAGAAHVAGGGLAVLLLDRADELDVVGVGDLGVGLRLEQVLDVQVVERADDRAARDGRDHLHRAQQAELGELREHPDVEEGSAVAAPGKGKAELRVLPFLGHWRPAARSHRRRGESTSPNLTHLGHDKTAAP